MTNLAEEDHSRMEALRQSRDEWCGMHDQLLEP